MLYGAEWRAITETCCDTSGEITIIVWNGCDRLLQLCRGLEVLGVMYLCTPINLETAEPTGIATYVTKVTVNKICCICSYGYLLLQKYTLGL